METARGDLGRFHLQTTIVKRIYFVVNIENQKNQKQNQIVKHGYFYCWQ